METILPGKYRHFKGKEYRVYFVAKHSETVEEMVVYQTLYGDCDFWVRPVSMFLEMVEHNGEMVKRFTYIGQ